MEPIRKTQNVKDGQINVRLPKRFWGRQVEIIVLPVPRKKSHSLRKKSLRGCLRNYANPSMIDREKEAWQEAVCEKYDHY